MTGIAARIKPDQVTLVPEQPHELTTQGGLDVVANRQAVTSAVTALREAGIRVSIFIDPDEAQVRSSSEVGADAVEINTGGWPITTATGCVEFMARAFCTATYANVGAGGGDDRIELVGAVRGFINGHYGNDVMAGGTGADVFEGGPGVDKVDYSKRLGEHITGTPGTGSDDGRPGEGDNVMADVEQVLFPPG
jgi:hypothetical protein